MCVGNTHVCISHDNRDVLSGRLVFRDPREAYIIAVHPYKKSIFYMAGFTWNITLLALPKIWPNSVLAIVHESPSLKSMQSLNL